MTLNDYQKAAMRTANPELTKRGLLEDGVLGLCGESGEVADILKKVNFQGHTLDKDHLIEELGDVLWYLSQCASAIGCNLDIIAEKNIEKLKARYPDGFDSERSIHRPEYGGWNELRRSN